MANRIPTIQDLHSGYVVVLRNGKAYMVVRIGDNFAKFLISADRTNSIDVQAYDHNLCIKKSVSNTSLDIMEVYGLTLGNNHRAAIRALEVNTQFRPLIWKRPEAVKLTLEEISAKLGYEVQIVANH